MSERSSSASCCSVGLAASILAASALRSSFFTTACHVGACRLVHDMSRSGRAMQTGHTPERRGNEHLQEGKRRCAGEDSVGSATDALLLAQVRLSPPSHPSAACAEATAAHACGVCPRLHHRALRAGVNGGSHRHRQRFADMPALPPHRQSLVPCWHGSRSPSPVARGAKGEKRAAWTAGHRQER